MQEVQRRPRMRPNITAFEEYAASDGAGVIGILRFFAALSLIGGLLAIVLAVLAIISGSSSAKDFFFFAFAFAIMVWTQAGLLFTLATVVENLVAIRKNVQHLAGIRANTIRQQDGPPIHPTRLSE